MPCSRLQSLPKPLVGCYQRCQLGLLRVARWSAVGALCLGLPVPVDGADSASPSLAQAEAPAERGRIVDRTYFFEAANRRQEYALFVPTSYRPEKPSPLIVLLHGWGSNPLQVMHYRGIMEEAEKRGYIVVAPEGYNAGGWYGSQGSGSHFQAGLPAPAGSPENLGELSERDVLNVLEVTRAQFRIDPKRTYLMGHSMGGGGTLYLGMKYPQNWAALAALSPAIFSDPAGLEAIRHLPIIVVQGDQDRLVKVENTRRWIAKMEALNLPHTYLEIKGGDHIFSIAANPKMIGEVFDFFDAHHL